MKLRLLIFAFLLGAILGCGGSLLEISRVYDHEIQKSIEEDHSRIMDSTNFIDTASINRHWDSVVKYKVDSTRRAWTLVSSGAPSWAKVNLSTDITGTIMNGKPTFRSMSLKLPIFKHKKKKKVALFSDIIADSSSWSLTTVPTGTSSFGYTGITIASVFDTVRTDSLIQVYASPWHWYWCRYDYHDRKFVIVDSARFH
jgi:hypothetical protein